MTAPFAPPPSRPMLAAVAIMLAVTVAIPFARRNDWMGWAAFFTLIMANVVLWGLMVWRLISWWREPHRPGRREP